MKRFIKNFQIAADKDAPHWAGPFFTIWTGQSLSLLGSKLVGFAVIWYLTKKSSSAAILSMATLLGMFPQVVLGPFVGALVDRWNRRRIMIVSEPAHAG